jgi:DNA-binding NtrC family response regulator
MTSSQRPKKTTHALLHRQSPRTRQALIGESPATRALRATISRFANLRQPVLVHGETGTGKEVVARALHDESPWADGPLVTVNCGAIPSNLAESELFGHERGSFTGADRSYRGAFLRADGGTLFLDEIGELPLALQAKLLRVLETSVVSPVGSEREEFVAVRVVAATHRDLWQMVAQGTFREDLLHRLCVLEIEIAPLRERAQDVDALLTYFSARLSEELGRPIELTPAARALALTHEWPGNVRALKNALTRAAVLQPAAIGPHDLVPKSDRTMTSTAKSCDDAAFRIPRGDYATMRRALLDAAVDEAGSVRRAAQVLKVPRSTLGAWLRTKENLR